MPNRSLDDEESYLWDLAIFAEADDESAEIAEDEVSERDDEEEWNGELLMAFRLCRAERFRAQTMIALNKAAKDPVIQALLREHLDKQRK
jgi:hypothetical protein